MVHCDERKANKLNSACSFYNGYPGENGYTLARSLLDLGSVQVVLSRLLMAKICRCLDHGDCDIKLGTEKYRKTSFNSFTQLTQLTVFAVARVWGPHHMGPYAQTYPVMGQKALYNLRDINLARTVYCLTSVTRSSLIPSPLHRILRDPRTIRLANHVEWRVYSADRCKH